MEELKRKENETDLEYIIRLVKGKNDGTYDIDYSELFKLGFNVELASDESRKRYYGLRMLIQYIDVEKLKNTTSNEILDEITLAKMELQKEKYKFFDYRNAYNKLLRERSRQEEINDIIIQALKEDKITKFEYKENNIKRNGNNDLLISLNDLHIGANVDNAWNKYNSDICRDRLENYLEKIIDISKTHNSENCTVWVNGDIINGNIHQSIAVTNKENVIQQVIVASELISNFLAELSKHFNKVSFVSVAGNHSRLGTKDDSLKDERLDDLIEWYLKARLQSFKNISFDYDKIDTTMYLINIRGLNYVGVHGDYDSSLSRIQALQMMVGKNVYAVLLGHLHHNKIDSVQGIKTVMAGSFLGVDDYCISKRIYGKPEQMVCVCNENGIVCNYDIQF